MITFGDQYTDPNEYATLNARLFAANLGRSLAEWMPMAQPKRREPILDWLEKNFRYPTGTRRGQRYSRKHQPATAMFLEQLDDPYWRRAVLIAPNQAGKSLSLVQFVLHVLINMGEDIITGIPDLDNMWAMKWKKDFLPVINNSRIKELLPERGAGTRGGVPNLLMFQNGCSLQAMGAGGGDTQRSAATTRVVAITELKDWGDSSLKSDEGTKADQLVRRTLQHQGNEMVLAESTITTEDNIAWGWFQGGTQTLVHLVCPSCEEAIAPEREHLVGWQDAKTEEEARSKARFCCPKCGVLISEVARLRALQNAIPLHRGQKYKNGEIVGDRPPTRTLSWRFSAATNMFANAGAIGVEEWKLRNERNASVKLKKNREITQAFFAQPVSRTEMRVDPLDAVAMMRRTRENSWGWAPEGTTKLFAGIDVRKTQVHWATVAYGAECGPTLCVWGTERVLQDIAFPLALEKVSRDLMSVFGDGVPVEGEETKVLPVSLVLMDAGWETWSVQKVTDASPFWMPVMGFGSGILRKKGYRAPKATNNTVKFIGNGFHLAYVSDRWLVEMDASKGKSRVHELLRRDMDSGDALAFGSAPEKELHEIVSQILAEQEEFDYEAGELVTKWSEPDGPNHYLDAVNYAIQARHAYAFMEELLDDGEGAGDDDDDDVVVLSSGGGMFG